MSTRQCLSASPHVCSLPTELRPIKAIHFEGRRHLAKSQAASRDEQTETTIDQRRPVGRLEGEVPWKASLTSFAVLQSQRLIHQRGGRRGSRERRSAVNVQQSIEKGRNCSFLTTRCLSKIVS